MVTSYQHQEIQYRPTKYKVLQAQQNLKINNLIFFSKISAFMPLSRRNLQKHSWEIPKEHNVYKFVYYHYTFRIKLILQLLSPHHRFVICCWNILICQMHSLFMNLSTLLPVLLLEDELNDFCKYICVHIPLCI